MAAGMSHERRRAPRVPERVPLAITAAEAVVEAETKNLSASGVYCALERFIAPMTKLQLAFELPQGDRPARIECSGVVVRVEPIITSVDRARYNTAIFFTDLVERDRMAISQFVRRRLANNPP
ncbi:MAG: PilZ domain-containing protein [Candidatus Omnitrophica bacterium]|nr:PilZ domain-containing protein [Candidatus Omnitrophota bacterium]